MGIRQISNSKNDLQTNSRSIRTLDLRQRDEQTHTESIYCVSIAQCGKKCILLDYAKY